MKNSSKFIVLRFLSVAAVCNSVLFSCTIPTISAKTPTPTAMFRVHDVDFKNTKLGQTCMIADLHCNITVSESSTGRVYTTKIPPTATTSGSYCDMNFVSLLQLGFNNAQLQMKFVKTDSSTTKSKSTAVYCSDCNIGEWRLSAMSFLVKNLTAFSSGTFSEPYQINSSASWQTLTTSAVELTTYGVDITRAFKCDDLSKMFKIKMDVLTVKNATHSRKTIDSTTWEIVIHFTNVTIQPFLVKNGVFNDPFLCKDITLDHALVITLPLLYFVILILFHHARSSHGLPCFRKSKITQENARLDPIQKVILESQEKQFLTVDYVESKTVTSTQKESTSSTAV